MRVGLFGFGKTGKAVAKVLMNSSEVELVWVMKKTHSKHLQFVEDYLDVNSDKSVQIYAAMDYVFESFIEAHPVDIIVDFSSPESVNYYGKVVCEKSIPLITAVSQYPVELQPYLEDIAARVAVLTAPNITIGVNFLLLASKVLKNIAPDADIEIIEQHFKHKNEASGTAKVIADHLNVDEQDIKQIRAGGIIGVHEVLFGFPFQTVRLKHESIAREAFGNGVLFALNNFPFGKRGLFKMEDLLLPYFQLSNMASEEAI